MDGGWSSNSKETLKIATHIELIYRISIACKWLNKLIGLYFVGVSQQKQGKETGATDMFLALIKWVRME